MSFPHSLFPSSPFPSSLPSPSSPSHWRGHLHLEFLHRSSKTILSYGHAQAPLKIQRPFYPEGDEVCHSVMLHTAGGIVGSDRLSNQIILHPNAQALVTTAAAAKVYGRSGKDAQQATQISIAEGACLEWFPQETIVFDGAVYRQEMRVDLAPGGMWLGWEMTRLGRSARGERFASGFWRSNIEVWQGDRLLWIDPQGIEGGSEVLDSWHGLAGCPVIASFVMLGQLVAEAEVEKVRSVWQGTGDVGATRLMAGILCRYRGHSTTEARHWFIQVWQILRSAYLNRPACPPRVWQL